MSKYPMQLLDGPIPGQRIKIKNGKVTKKFTLVQPPWIQVGDVVTFGKIDWDVVKVKNTEVIASTSFPKAKTKKVFPGK